MILGGHYRMVLFAPLKSRSVRDFCPLQQYQIYLKGPLSEMCQQLVRPDN